MHTIAIISASIRTGRKSHRVALYLQEHLKTSALAEVDMIDLAQLNFPLFHERLQYLQNPAAEVVEFAKRIKEADGVIIVTPEYNGGYPAALKNVIDLLYPEWKRKPIGLAAVSDGPFAGSQVLTSLSFSLLKIGALVSGGMYRVPSVQKAFDENGIPTEKELTDKRVKPFVDDFFWCVEARKKME